ncbi:MAG: DUF92 domain-containing protein [Anaerolineae bacterium]
MNTLWQVVTGMVVALTLVLLGRRASLLAIGGQWVLAASVLAIWALRGWSWGITIGLVLLASGVSVAYRRAEKLALTGMKQSPALDATAVTARVAWPLALAILSDITNIDYYAAYAGGLAAVCADVWATEIGLLSAEPPRSLTSGLAARRGTPGAVSPLGTMAAAGAAGLTGFVALAVLSIHAIADRGIAVSGMLWLPLAALLGGIAGVLTDSLLGGAAQATYYCDSCEAISELPVHHCGAPARQIHGWPWMTNEAVDLVSSLVGAGVAAATIGILGAM